MEDTPQTPRDPFDDFHVIEGTLAPHSPTCNTLALGRSYLLRTLQQLSEENATCIRALGATLAPDKRDDPAVRPMRLAFAKRLFSLSRRLTRIATEMSLWYLTTEVVCPLCAETLGTMGKNGRQDAQQDSRPWPFDFTELERQVWAILALVVRLDGADAVAAFLAPDPARTRELPSTPDALSWVSLLSAHLDAVHARSATPAPHHSARSASA